MLRFADRKRRAEEREEVCWPADWRSFTDQSGGRSRVRDVSARGLFVEVSARLPALPLGTPVRLWLRPSEPDAEQMTVLGTVRWRGLSATHGCPGIGVELFESEDRLEPPAKEL